MPCYAKLRGLSQLGSHARAGRQRFQAIGRAVEPPLQRGRQAAALQNDRAAEQVEPDVPVGLIERSLDPRTHLNFRTTSNPTGTSGFTSVSEVSAFCV
jgi:hypothetical protein